MPRLGGRGVLPVEGDVMQDRFFCRRNLVCFEACSVCEVCGDCDMCVAFGQLDRCQKCTRYYEPGSLAD